MNKNDKIETKGLVLTLTQGPKKDEFYIHEPTTYANAVDDKNNKYVISWNGENPDWSNPDKVFSIKKDIFI